MSKYEKYLKLIIVIVSIIIIVDVLIILVWSRSESKNLIDLPFWSASKSQAEGQNPFMIHGDEFYYTGRDGNSIDLYKVAVAEMNQENPDNQLIFRGRNGDGAIDLFQLKDLAFFTYHTDFSPHAGIQDIYQIDDTGCRMLLSQYCKFDFWGEDLVLIALDQDENNLIRYKQATFAENISYDQHLSYLDLYVLGDDVYTLAEYLFPETVPDDISRQYAQHAVLYKMNLTTLEQLKISDNYIRQFTIDPVKGILYYASDDRLCAMNLDGSEARDLNAEPVDYFILTASTGAEELNTIYYSGMNGRGLYKLDIPSGNIRTMLKSTYTVSAKNHFIYVGGYLAVKLDKGKEGFVILDETGNEVFSTTYKINSFSFDGRTVVYESEKGRLFKFDLPWTY